MRVACPLPGGNRFGFGLEGISFGFIRLGFQTLGGVAGNLKLGACLLLGDLRLALLAKGGVVGDGFNAERFLRVEPSGGGFGIDRDNRRQNSDKGDDARAEQRHHGNALRCGSGPCPGRGQYRIPLK